MYGWEEVTHPWEGEYIKMWGVREAEGFGEHVYLCMLVSKWENEGMR